ncbi:MAG: tetraacyldisaccharide 4'-kinase [Chitinivibrionales bacterium]|nr:tetraacyldisaccharide 4'-kinase [Chitinivibrionales bacterium]MBD3396713.1 tetraacyldisaccharide 4'-kinase [Chitinivibrionales bacterium]
MHLQPLGANPFATALAFLYGPGVYLRNKWYDHARAYRPPRKTISIGGIHAGGTGKTPVALLVGHHLVESGRQVAFLSRGYRRRLKTPVIVRPEETRPWDEIGDEPCVMRQELPEAWLGVGASRARSASRLSRLLDQSAVFVLDDGFQHRSIHRDLDIVCLPPDPFRDRLIPSGYLREPLSSLGRADVLCVIGARHETDILEGSSQRLERRFPAAMTVALYQEAQCWVCLRTGEEADRPPLKNPAVLTGIARPERYIRMVREQGIIPHSVFSYEDHHVFTGSEIRGPLSGGADGLCTTHKDACRLRSFALVQSIDIWYLKVVLRFCRETARRSFGDLLSA